MDMLDKRMTYTCGYWKGATTLDEAQEAKLDLTCKKLKLQPGQNILDVGCGWGSFIKFAAEKYKAHCVGITVSKEQAVLGRRLCAGLPVEIRLQDYREVDEKFDHIVSLGMFEHVGAKNYGEYMKVIRRALKDDGLFLLQTIGAPDLNNEADPGLRNTYSQIPCCPTPSRSSNLQMAYLSLKTGTISAMIMTPL
jgi:cyclopropane-fatty-acyl-phospholipid synthase